MVNDILETILKYNNIAKKCSESVLVKDKTMLQFAAYCLSSRDESTEVIELAVDTLSLLASNDRNVAQLKGTYGVLEAVEFTATNDELPDYLKEKAQNLYKHLNSKDAPAYCTRSKTKVRDSKWKLKLVSLHIEGLSKENQRNLESVIIGVQGVVSLVLDIDHQRCTLRVHESVLPSKIAVAIFEATGLESRLLSRNRIGQEVLKPLLETSSSNTIEDLPPYLKEEDSPVKEQAVSNLFVIKDKTSYWLKSALGYIQESFYW